VERCIGGATSPAVGRWESAWIYIGLCWWGVAYIGCCGGGGDLTARVERESSWSGKWSVTGMVVGVRGGDSSSRGELANIVYLIKQYNYVM
jgi:hypothetical protein